MVHILMLFPSAILFQKSSRPVTYGKTAGFFCLWHHSGLYLKAEMVIFAS